MPKPDVIYSDNTWLSIIADATSAIDKTSVKTGSKNSIGGSAVQMYTSTYPLRVGITVKASVVNAGRIYVGTSSAVTPNTSADNDGFELAAGESHFIPVNDLNKVWLVASQSGQKAFYLAI